MSKKRTGVALDDCVITELDKIVDDSKYLAVTRSEVINALLHSFFKSDVDYETKVEKVRGYIIQLRKGLFKMLFF